jgi:peptidoglycan hydrolase CwlO-like protein
MPVMLERWNDDKMDALDAKVGRLEVGLARTDAKVDRIEADVAKLDTKLDEHRKETKTAFERIDEKFERVDDKFDRMHRTLLVIGGAVIATLIAALAGHP